MVSNNKNFIDSEYSEYFESIIKQFKPLDEESIKKNKNYQKLVDALVESNKIYK